MQIGLQRHRRVMCSERCSKSGQCLQVRASPWPAAAVPLTAWYGRPLTPPTPHGSIFPSSRRAMGRTPPRPLNSIFRRVSHAAERCHFLQPCPPSAAHRPPSRAWWMWSFGRDARGTGRACASACNAGPECRRGAVRGAFGAVRDRVVCATRMSSGNDQTCSGELSTSTFR